MKTVTIKHISIGITLFATTLVSTAQEAQAECGLRVATGPANGVYTRLARDLQKVCGNVASLCQVPSTGGLQNLIALSASEADIGFAQLDLVQKMGKEGDENIKELQAVAPMHVNLLHIVTQAAGSKIGGSGWISLRSETKVYRKFSDLKGAKVALVGSAQLLGQSLEKQLGYGMQFVLADTDEQAITQLNAGNVQAVFTTGGWPYPPIGKHASNSGLMLAEYDLAAPQPFAIVKRNYVNLGAHSLPFLAAPNLLVTRPFKPNGEKGKLVAALQSCILNHLDELQEGSYHAVWKEIKNPTDTLGMSRYGKLLVPVAAGKSAGRS